MSRAAVPFHCPFCGETDLRPHEVVTEDGTTSSPHGAWDCRSCLRAFGLKSLGMLHAGDVVRGDYPGAVAAS